MCCIVASEIFFLSTAVAGTHHHPGDDRVKRMDIKAITNENYITMEMN